MSKKSRNLIGRAEQRQAESDSKAAIYKQKKTATGMHKMPDGKMMAGKKHPKK